MSGYFNWKINIHFMTQYDTVLFRVTWKMHSLRNLYDLKEKLPAKKFPGLPLGLRACGVLFLFEAVR